MVNGNWLNGRLAMGIQKIEGLDKYLVELTELNDQRWDTRGGEARKTPRF